MLIREATPDDLPVIVEFNRALAAESEDLTLDLDVLRRGVARALASPTLCRYYVAVLAGRVVGQTMVTYELSDWRDGLVHWIQSVYVERDARGRGVFRALYEHVHAQAHRTGSRLVRLYVERDNAPAIGVYERLGMQRSAYHLYEAAVAGAPAETRR
ncbi:MAG: GNAT family N-acetyltransferase [Burkholderiales bacterium]|nr:GNAT family N-acetyltransferase [Burkholderiales bacterium]